MTTTTTTTTTRPKKGTTLFPFARRRQGRQRRNTNVISLSSSLMDDDDFDYNYMDDDGDDDLEQLWWSSSSDDDDDDDDNNENDETTEEKEIVFTTNKNQQPPSQTTTTTTTTTLLQKQKTPLTSSSSSSSSSPPKQQQQQQQRKKNSFSPGKNGYNVTLLAECNYDPFAYYQKHSRVQFDFYLEYLRMYVDEFGHANVPQSYTVVLKKDEEKDEEELEGIVTCTTKQKKKKKKKPTVVYLGQWLSRIRSSYRRQQQQQQHSTTTTTSNDNNNNHHHLTPNQIQTLNKLNITWNIKSGHDLASFYSHYDRLRKFQQTYGRNVRVPRENETYRELALWCDRQRLFLKQWKMMRRRSNNSNNDNRNENDGDEDGNEDEDDGGVVAWKRKKVQLLREIGLDDDDYDADADDAYNSQHHHQQQQQQQHSGAAIKTTRAITTNPSSSLRNLNELVRTSFRTQWMKMYQQLLKASSDYHHHHCNNSNSNNNNNNDEDAIWLYNLLQNNPMLYVWTMEQYQELNYLLLSNKKRIGATVALESSSSSFILTQERRNALSKITMFQPLIQKMKKQQQEEKEEKLLSTVYKNEKKEKEEECLSNKSCSPLLSSWWYVVPPNVDIAKLSNNNNNNNFDWNVMYTYLVEFWKENGHCDVGPLSMLLSTTSSSSLSSISLLATEQQQQQQQQQENEENDCVNTKMMLYPFVLRLRWEYHHHHRHHFLRRFDRTNNYPQKKKKKKGLKFTSKSFDDDDDDDIVFLIKHKPERVKQLNDIGFDWDIEQNNDDYRNDMQKDKKEEKDSFVGERQLAREYKWWQKYHDLARYKRLFGTCNVMIADDDDDDEEEEETEESGSKSSSSYKDLRAWVELQKKSFNALLSSKGNSNNNDANGSSSSSSSATSSIEKDGDYVDQMTERRYVALLNLGLDLKHTMISFRDDDDTVVDEDGVVVDHGRIIGRKPAILSLDDNHEDENDEGTTALLQVTTPDVTPTPPSTAGRMGKEQWNELVWLARYKEMKKYREENGHCRVMLSLEKEEEKNDEREKDQERNNQNLNARNKVDDYLHHKKLKRLALWAYDQRSQYRNYKMGWKKTSMTRRRIERLNKIGFEWDNYYFGDDDDDDDDNDDTKSVDDDCDQEISSDWTKMIASLRQYKKRHGDCYVPLAYRSDRKLGRWVYQMRRLYQINSGGDTSEEMILAQQQGNSINADDNEGKQVAAKRIDELLSVGLDLSCDNVTFGRRAFASTWNSRVDELSLYKELHGNADVPLDYTSPYYDLGVWVREQRSLYNACKAGIGETHLTTERIKKLDEMNFVWESK